MVIRSVSLKSYQGLVQSKRIIITPVLINLSVEIRKRLNLFWTILSMEQLLEILVEYSALTVGDGRPLRVPRNQLFA